MIEKYYLKPKLIVPNYQLNPNNKLENRILIEQNKYKQIINKHKEKIKLDKIKQNLEEKAEIIPKFNFKQEIERRFQNSVANKIYIFPKNLDESNSSSFNSSFESIENVQLYDLYSQNKNRARKKVLKTEHSNNEKNIFAKDTPFQIHNKFKTQNDEKNYFNSKLEENFFYKGTNSLNNKFEGNIFLAKKIYEAKKLKIFKNSVLDKKLEKRDPKFILTKSMVDSVNFISENRSYINPINKNKPLGKLRKINNSSFNNKSDISLKLFNMKLEDSSLAKSSNENIQLKDLLSPDIQKNYKNISTHNRNHSEKMPLINQKWNKMKSIKTNKKLISNHSNPHSFDFLDAFQN